MILLGISLGIFTAYVVTVWLHYGIHTSISASWYSLPEKHKWSFTIWCWGFAVPMTIVAMMNGGGFLAFFAGALIAGVGAAPRNWDGANQFLQRNFGFREGEKVVHKIFAYVGVILSQLSLAFEFRAYYFVALFVILSTIFLVKSKHSIWYIELVAYFSYLIVLLGEVH